MNALNQVVPYNWRGFWIERLTTHALHAPLTGIELSGWKLVYDENASELWRANESTDKKLDAGYSIGLRLTDDGTVEDVIEGMIAAKAGIGPGMKIAGVNGRRFSEEVFHDALRGTKNSSAPLELLVENTEFYRTVKLDYHEGEKFPHLVRDQSKPDLLSDIIEPR